LLLQGRGGRERIVAPNGNEIAPANDPQREGTMVWRWQGLLDEGSFTSGSEI